MEKISIFWETKNFIDQKAWLQLTMKLSLLSRTVNSDCCPDYFTHCEGLSLDTGPEALYQTAAAPETIMKPDNCEYGLLEVTGEEHLVLSQKLEHKDL